MNRTQHEEDVWEVDFAFSHRALNSKTTCRELSGTERKNHAARYGRRPTRQSSATKGIHRRGQSRQVA